MIFADEYSEIIISENEVSERIDSFLSEKLQISRSRVQKLIDDEKITVNDNIPKKNYLICKDDKIGISDFENEEIDAKPQDIPIDIVYEDNDIIVVNKPQNMVVHPAPGNLDSTLVNALLFHCKDSLSGINGKIRPGIVHRIDKDTSGLLVCAKNDLAHEKLAEMFSQHDFERKYIAILYSAPKNDEGRIELAIGRSQKDRKKMAFYPIGTKNTKDAITNYKVLQRYKGYSLVEFRLETGRTHQIRVHALSMGCPVLADPLYAKGRETFSLKGQCLHAEYISFKHPISGEVLSFTAPLPDYFENTLKIIKARYNLNDQYI